MKIRTFCSDCAHEKKNTNVYVEVTNSSIYYAQCENGHEVVCAVQTAEFMTLFEMGVLALNDGYTREAVTSLAVAIERFHEFMLKVMLLEKKVEWKEIDDTWKGVAAQSERQLGAYYFVFVSLFKKSPPVIANTKVAFRNNVIHKGLIPTYEEAKEYERFAYEYIHQLLIELKSKCSPENIIEVIVRHINLYNENPKYGPINGLIGFSDMFNLYYVEANEVTYEKAIERVIKNGGKYIKR